MNVPRVGGTPEFKRPDEGAAPQAAFTPPTLPSTQSGGGVLAGDYSERRKVQYELHDHAAGSSAFLQAADGKIPHVEAKTIAEGLPAEDLEKVELPVAVGVTSSLAASIKKAIEGG